MMPTAKDKKGAIRIVVADDNLLIQESLKDIFTESGFAVDTASNGYELLAYLKDRSADIVILDLMMPGKDGLEIVSTIKAVCPSIKILIYTGFQKYETSLCTRGADGFLLKEKGPEKLLQLIKDFL